MPLVTGLELFPVLESVVSFPPPVEMGDPPMQRGEAVYLAGRRGRVPLAVSLKPFPVPVAMFRLECVWGRGVVQLTIGPAVGLVGRCEGPLVMGGPAL